MREKRCVAAAERIAGDDQPVEAAQSGSQQAAGQQQQHQLIYLPPTAATTTASTAAVEASQQTVRREPVGEQSAKTLLIILLPDHKCERKFELGQFDVAAAGNHLQLFVEFSFAAQFELFAGLAELLLAQQQSQLGLKVVSAGRPSGELLVGQLDSRQEQLSSARPDERVASQQLLPESTSPVELDLQLDSVFVAVLEQLVELFFVVELVVVVVSLFGLFFADHATGQFNADRQSDADLEPGLEERSERTSCGADRRGAQNAHR